MCFNCFINKMAKPFVNEQVIACAKLIDRVYSYTATGGNAHIVVDDWNLEDHSINFCIESIKNEKDVSPEERIAVEECLFAMKELTEDERHCAMGIHDGFINIETLKNGEH